MKLLVLVALAFLIAGISAINFTGEQAQQFLLGYVPSGTTLHILPDTCCGSNGQFDIAGVAYTYEFGHPENVRVGDIIVYFTAEPSIVNGQLVQPALPPYPLVAHQVIWRNWTDFTVRGTNTSVEDGTFPFEGHFLAKRVYIDQNVQKSLCAFSSANRSIAAVYNPGWACGSPIPPPHQNAFFDVLDAIIKFIRGLFGG